MSTPSRRSFVLVSVLLAGLIFAPSLGGGFTSDDYRLVVEDSRIGDPTRLVELLSSPFWGFDVEAGSVASHYQRIHRPIVKLAFVLGHRLSNGRPFGFHVVALATHLAVVALVFRFLRRRAEDDWAALAGTVLFAVHPSRAETVAWISGVSDSLMVLFSLLAAEAAALRTERRALRYVALVASGFAAAASKEPGLLVAPMLVAIETVSLDAKGIRRFGSAAATAMGACSAIALALYVGRQASSTPWHLDVERALAAFGAAIERVALAAPITMLPFPMRYAEGGAPEYDSSLVVLGLVGLLVGSVVVGAATRRPAARPFALAFALFFVAYLPVLGLDGHAVQTLLCDRFAYAPLLGVALAVTSVVGAVGEARRRSLSLVLCLGTLFYLPTTIEGVALYGDENALVAHELRLHPDEPQEIWGVALWEMRHGLYDEAFRDLLRSADLARAQHQPTGDWGYLVLALSVRVTATPDREIGETRPFRDAMVRMTETGRFSATVGGRRVEVRLTEPDRARVMLRPELVHLPIAVLSMRLREYPTAARWASEATRREPRYADAWLVRLTALARGGDHGAARAVLAEARRAIPERAEHLDGFEAALGRAESLARLPADDEAARARRAAAVAEALGDPAGVLTAFGPRCRDGSEKDAAIRCAVASASLDDLDGAVAMLDARARVAPSEAPELARVAAALRDEAERRAARRRNRSAAR